MVMGVCGLRRAESGCLETRWDGEWVHDEMEPERLYRAQFRGLDCPEHIPTMYSHLETWSMKTASRSRRFSRNSRHYRCCPSIRTRYRKPIREFTDMIRVNVH